MNPRTLGVAIAIAGLVLAGAWQLLAIDEPSSGEPAAVSPTVARPSAMSAAAGSPAHAASASRPPAESASAPAATAEPVSTADPSNPDAVPPHRNAVLRGIAIDGTTMKPLPGAEVVAGFRGWTTMGAPLESDWSDSGWAERERMRNSGDARQRRAAILVEPRIGEVLPLVERATAKSGDDGRFAISGLPPGRHIVTVTGKALGNDASVWIATDASPSITLTVYPAATLRVTVRDSAQQPMPATWVALSTNAPRSAASMRQQPMGLGRRANDRGMAEFTLPAGAAWSVAVATGPGAREPLADVEPLKEGEVRSIDVTVRDAARAVVTVTGPDGKPVANAQVTAQVRGGAGEPQWRGSERTGDDGMARFAALKLIVPGELRFTVAATGFAAAASAWAPAAAAAPIAVEVRVGAGSAVRVRVDGADGTVSGASVDLIPDEATTASTGWVQLDTQVSGADGTALFPAVAPGTYHAWVFHARLGSRVSLPFAVGSEGTVEVAVGLFQGPMRELLVLDSFGGTVEGAKVAWYEQAEDTARPRSVTTDADGMATLPAGSLQSAARITVSKAGYADATIDGWPASLGDTHVVTLEAEASVSGTVISSDGAAVTGASITASANRTWRQIASGAAGEFSVKGLPPGPLTLIVDARGYARGTAQLTLSAGEALTGLRIELGAGAQITGKVRGPNGPVAEGLVWTVGADGEGWRSTAPIQANGTFVLENVEPGTLRVHASAPGHAEGVSDEVKAEHEGSATVEIVLRTGAVLTGIITREDGTPIAGQQVYVAVPSVNLHVAATDSTGRYLFDGLTPGDIFVELTLEGETGRRTVPMRLVAGRNVMDFQATPSDHTLKIAVTRGGAAVEGASLRVVRLGGNAGFVQKWVSTDKSGTASLDSLTAGNWAVWMTSPIEIKRQVTIARDVKEVLLEIAIPVGAITGTVRKAGGEAIGGARIEVRPMHSFNKTAAEQGFFERLGEQWNTRASADGTYRVEGLPDGSFAVTVLADGFALATRTDVAVSSGATSGIDFALTAGSTVVLAVSDHEGKPVAGALIQALSPDGRWVYSGSEPWMGPGTNGAGEWATTSASGQWTFVILHPRHPRKYVPVTVPATGEPLKVPVQLERGWDVLIAVKDAAGAPVPNARVDLIDAQGRVFEMNGTVALLSGSLKTSSEGTVALNGVGEGTYTVRVTTAAGKVSEFPGRAVGGEELTLIEVSLGS